MSVLIKIVKWIVPFFPIFLFTTPGQCQSCEVILPVDTWTSVILKSEIPGLNTNNCISINQIYNSGIVINCKMKSETFGDGLAIIDGYTLHLIDSNRIEKIKITVYSAMLGASLLDSVGRCARTGDSLILSDITAELHFKGSTIKLCSSQGATVSEIRLCLVADSLGQNLQTLTKKILEVQELQSLMAEYASDINIDKNLYRYAMTYDRTRNIYSQRFVFAAGTEIQLDLTFFLNSIGKIEYILDNASKEKLDLSSWQKRIIDRAK